MTPPPIIVALTERLGAPTFLHQPGVHDIFETGEFA